MFENFDAMQGMIYVLGGWSLLTFFLMTKLWTIKDFWLPALKATTPVIGPNNWAMAVRWSVDNRIRLDNVEIDAKDPFKWFIKPNKEESSREIKKGDVRGGPAGIDLVLFTDDCTSSVSMTLDVDEQKQYNMWKSEIPAKSVNVDQLTKNKYGSSPAYVDEQLDLAYTDGLQDGIRKSQNFGFLDTLSQNWQTLLMLALLLGVGGLVFYDKVITAPACQGQLNNEIAQKNILIGKCSNYVSLKDLTMINTVNVTDSRSDTGAYIKNS